MAAVHIGIGHDNNAAVAQVVEAESFANASGEGRNQGFDLICWRGFYPDGRVRC